MKGCIATIKTKVGYESKLKVLWGYHSFFMYVSENPKICRPQVVVGLDRASAIRLQEELRQFVLCYDEVHAPKGGSID